MVELLQNTWKKAEVTHWIDLLDSFMFSQIDRIREFNNSKLCSLHKGWSGNFLLIKWYRTLIDLHVNISTSRTILPKFYVNILTQVIRKPIRNWIYSHWYISYRAIHQGRPADPPRGEGVPNPDNFGHGGGRGVTCFRTSEIIKMKKYFFALF